MNAWAAPATVSKRGRIHFCHCESYNSWEGDTSNLASPDIGLERVWNIAWGDIPTTQLRPSIDSRSDISLLIKTVDGGSA